MVSVACFEHHVVVCLCRHTLSAIAVAAVQYPLRAVHDGAAQTTAAQLTSYTPEQTPW